MKILTRFAAAILVAAALSSAFPGRPQAQPPPGWLPPGLSSGLSPYGIEAITRALAYGAERNAWPGELESFAQQGLS